MKKVTAAIIQKEGLILVAQRPEGDLLAGYWEFPGGKIEPGETPEECLQREIDEELGLAISVESFFCESIYSYPKGVIQLLAYLCTCTDEPSQMTSHSAIQWLKPQELKTLTFAPADIPIVELIATQAT